jgi:hypothetical protein
MMKKIVTLSSQDVQIVKKKQIQDKVTLYLKKTTEIEICPYCGFPTTRTHGKVKTRTVMDKPTSLFKVELELIRRRCFYNLPRFCKNWRREIKGAKRRKKKGEF